MRVPERLKPLLEQGLIEDVIRPLLSGKEASVYLVQHRGDLAVAKVYKEASQRSFRQRADYTEGRKVRNSRTARAIAKGSKFGKEKMEEAWRTAEIDAIYRLDAAGVRIPKPLEVSDGVLVMELVTGTDGHPAPRLADVRLGRDEARKLFDTLLRETVKMLCAGVVHGDLSDFNVLLSADGPVIIDFPQWVDAAHNRNARTLLIRDVDNLVSFLARWDDSLKRRNFGTEMWAHYEAGDLTPNTKLTGKYKPKKQPKVDPMALLAEFEELERASRERRAKLGLPDRPARKPVVYEDKAPPRRDDSGGGGRNKGRRRGKGKRRQPDRAAKKPPSSSKKKGRSDDDLLSDLDALLIVDD